MVAGRSSSDTSVEVKFVIDVEFGIIVSAWDRGVRLLLTKLQEDQTHQQAACLAGLINGQRRLK
jgi:hypothetical protein